MTSQQKSHVVEQLIKVVDGIVRSFESGYCSSSALAALPEIVIALDKLQKD